MKYNFKDSSIDEIQHDQYLNSHMEVSTVQAADEKISQNIWNFIKKRLVYNVS